MKSFLTTFLFCFIYLLTQAQNYRAIDSLKRVCYSAKHDTTQILALCYLAFEYRFKHLDSCFLLAEKALNRSKQINFGKGAGAAYSVLATAHERAGDKQKALELYQESLKVRETIGDKKGAANSLNNLAALYQSQGDFQKALEYYHKSLQIRTEINDKRGMAVSLNNIGSVHRARSDYPQALEFFFKSVKIKEEIKDGDLASSYINIGSIYGSLGNNSASLEYYQKSLKIAEGVGNKQQISLILNNIANVHSRQCNYTSALEYHRNSLKIKEEIKDKAGVAYSLSSIGLIYFRLNDYDSAMEYYQKSLNLAKQIGDKYLETQCLERIALTYLQINNHQQSIEYALKGLQLAKEISTLAYIASISKALYQIYKSTGEYMKALEYHELYKQTNDSIFNVEKSKAIANLEARAELEKKAKEIELLNKSKELLEKDNQLQKIENERQRNARIALEKQAEADRLRAAAQRERDAHKQDSLRILAEKRQLEAEKLKAREQELKAESKARQLEIVQEKEAREFQQKINYLVIAGLVISLVFVYLIYCSRQKEKHSKEIIAQQKDEILQKKETLEIQAHKLDQANKTKDKIFAILGHDLRSPINSLEGLLSLAEEGTVSQEEFLALLPYLHSNVKNVQNMLENLLQWSISQMQGMNTNPTNVSLSLIIVEKVELFSEIANKKGISISAQIEPNLNVWADVNHVRLLLQNLINNAIKFTPEGGKVIVNTYIEEEFVIVSITDTGIGMTEEQVEKLFKKNESFTTYGTSGEKGTGLGLQLCQEIVAKNGGKIWVVSQKDKGSTFSFSLPINISENQLVTS
ncbi:MAG: tetratricopeptide repeat protein [Microscillaceae bacterium]|nr:tetratricopeptide repeat protein [Microscillaceae bacterium]MDW8459587.1 tetratricopeptide repeat protein [Cytophagales bacterium]